MNRESHAPEPARRTPVVVFATSALALLAALNAWFVDYIADDAFIIFRYIRNAEAGHGLVFNVGERVEGYSTVLWLALLAAAHRLMPMVSLPVLARVGGVVAAMGTVVVVALRWPARDVGRVVLLSAAAIVAADASFAAWAAAGLETPLFTLLVTAGAIETARVLDGRPLGWWPGLWFALASMTRPDGPLFLGVALAFVCVGEWWRGRLTVGTTVRLLVPALVLVVPHLLWRHAYYGAWVPNTAVAKVPGGLDHLREGFAYVRNFTRERDTLVWVPLAALAFAQRRSLWLAYLFATIGAHLAYVMYVGGDSLGFYRFMVPVMPLMYLAAALGVHDTADWLSHVRVPRQARAGLATLAVAGLAWVSIRPAVQPIHWDDPQSGLSFPGDGETHPYRWYGNYFVERLSIAARYLNEHAAPGAVVASTPAGAIGFYLDRPLIDMLGLNDRHIAATSGVYDGPDARAGHEKGDGAYVLSREPDYILLGNVAVLPEPIDDEEMAERLVMKSEHEIWYDPGFHEHYVRESVRLRDSGPFQYFTYYRRR